MRLIRWPIGMKRGMRYSNMTVDDLMGTAIYGCIKDEARDDVGHNVSDMGKDKPDHEVWGYVSRNMYWGIGIAMKNTVGHEITFEY